MGEKVTVVVKVDAKYALAFLKILKWTIYLWWPFRNQILAWTHRNLTRFLQVKISYEEEP